MAGSMTTFLVRQLIPDLYETYGNATKALDYLKTVNLGIRKQDFLNIWREALDFDKKKDTWKYTTKDSIISPSSMTLTEKNLTTLYQHIGNISYTDNEGNSIERQISFGTNELLTPNEIQQQLQDLLEASASTYGVPEDYELSHLGTLTVSQ